MKIAHRIVLYFQLFVPTMIILLSIFLWDLDCFYDTPKIPLSKSLLICLRHGWVRNIESGCAQRSLVTVVLGSKPYVWQVLSSFLHSFLISFLYFLLSFLPFLLSILSFFFFSFPLSSLTLILSSSVVLRTYYMLGTQELPQVLRGTHGNQTKGLTYATQVLYQWITSLAERGYFHSDHLHDQFTLPKIHIGFKQKFLIISPWLIWARVKANGVKHNVYFPLVWNQVWEE